MDILQTFMAFLQNFIFQEFHILQNRCILMQLCFKNCDAWNICLIEFLHQSVQIIAPCFEIGKHASAHQYMFRQWQNITIMWHLHYLHTFHTKCLNY